MSSVATETEAPAVPRRARWTIRPRLPLLLVLALFVAYAAGRSLGADALLRRRVKPDTLLGRIVALVS